MAIHLTPSALPAGSAATFLSELHGNGGAAAKAPSKGQLAVREKFQDFVGGTFYKEMLKSLRAAQKPSKYLNGGQAEKIFQGQMDQQIAENLARQYGGPLAAPLFESYARQSLGGASASPLSSSPIAEAGHALDAVA
jgi:Rod binding domain-containing protein